jgi:ABC-type branched-subunit amino acid transport system ATPase component
MLDEPSFDLAPNPFTAVLNNASEFNRETRVAVLIVEQKVTSVFRIADRAYRLPLANVVLNGSLEHTTIDNLHRILLG